MPKQKIHLGSIFVFSLLIFIYAPVQAQLPAIHWMSYDDSLDNRHFFSVGYVNPQEESQGLGVGFQYDFSEIDKENFPYVRGSVFWDQRSSPQNTFLTQADTDHQLSVNLEWHAEDWSLHANTYLPSPATYKTQAPHDLRFVGLDGYRLGFHHYHIQPQQSVTPGTDLRLAQWWTLGEAIQIRSESTVYRYDLPDGTFAMGTVAETSLSWTPKDEDWHISLSLRERIDTMKDQDMYAGIQVSIPLGQPPKKTAQSSQTWRKLNAVAQTANTSASAKKSSSLRPILRNYGITHYNHVQIDHDFSPAINPLTGKPYGKVIFVAQQATGDGTQSSPASLTQAMTIADEDGIIVMEGNRGSIHSPQPITIGPYALIVGGGYRLPVYDAQGQHGIAKLGQKSSPIFINQPQQPALTLTGYAQAHQIDLTGGNVGIHIKDGQHIQLNNVEVGGTKAAGMVIEPSQFITLQNCRIRHTTNEGIIGHDIGKLHIENTKITNTGQSGLLIHTTNQVDLKNVTVQHSFADGAVLKNNQHVTMDHVTIDETWAHGLVADSNHAIQADQIYLHNHGGHGLWLKGSMQQSQWTTTKIDYARQDALHLDIDRGNHVFNRLGIYESCTTGIHCPTLTQAHITVNNLKLETRQGVGLHLADNSPNIIINQGDINQETWTDYRFKTPVLIGNQPGHVANVTTHEPPHPNRYLFEKTQSAEDYYTPTETSAIFAETTWKPAQDYFFKTNEPDRSMFFSK